MRNGKSKPTYQFIRYDVRPSAGLTNDESDYLANCVAKLQNLEFVSEICLAFELPSSQDVPRGTGLHAHLGIVFKRARRTDKVPILDMAKYRKEKGWSHHAVKTVKAELWRPSEYWKMGYVQKDGEWDGHCRDYSMSWYDHTRVMRQQKVRTTAITCSVFADEVVNWWLGNYTKIIRDLKKINPCRTTINYIHVLAHMICTTKCDLKMTRVINHRAFYATATLKCFQEVCDKLNYVSDLAGPAELLDIREKYPVGGLHSWAVPPDLPPVGGEE